MNVPITRCGMPRPTLFLIASGHRLSETHVHFSTTAFTALGWHVVKVLGFNTEQTRVPRGAGATSWLG
eukprot:4366869-Prorocentrum_lima.AAC.1